MADVPRVLAAPDPLIALAEAARIAGMWRSMSLVVADHAVATVRDAWPGFTAALDDLATHLPQQARQRGEGEDDAEVWIPPSTDCMDHAHDPCPHCGSRIHHVRTGRCGTCGRRPTRAAMISVARWQMHSTDPAEGERIAREREAAGSVPGTATSHLAEVVDDADGERRAVIPVGELEALRAAAPTAPERPWEPGDPVYPAEPLFSGSCGPCMVRWTAPVDRCPECGELSTEALRARVSELETAARRPRLEPCACGHARREHASYEDGVGECEDESCECEVYEARGWEAS